MQETTFSNPVLPTEVLTYPSLLQIGADHGYLITNLCLQSQFYLEVLAELLLRGFFGCRKWVQTLVDVSFMLNFATRAAGSDFS